MIKKFGSFILTTLLLTCIIGGQTASATKKDPKPENKGETIYFDVAAEEAKAKEEIIRQNSLARTPDEIWTLTKTETLATNILLSTDVEALIPKGSSTESSFNLSVSAGATIKGIPINVGFSYSLTYNYSGPGYSVPLANNASYGYLTHSVPVAYTKGDIKRYTYRVTNMMTGTYLRTVTSTSAIKKEASKYNIGVQSAASFKAENTAATAYKTYTNYSDYSAKVRTLNSSYLWF